MLSEFLADFVATNCLQDGIYVEPFAGGAGAALNLLFGEHVQRVVLNDADPCIYAFWHAMVSRKDDFIRHLRETPITIEEWKRQRDIYRNHARYSRLQVAFASFYLNRFRRQTSSNMIQVEWDPAKAKLGLRKHGVVFKEAASAFKDPLSITVYDPGHSEEDRFITFGHSASGRLLMVTHTDVGLFHREILSCSLD